jgi:DNA-binding LytR/AlgR family response regulator
MSVNIKIIKKIIIWIFILIAITIIRFFSKSDFNISRFHLFIETAVLVFAIAFITVPVAYFAMYFLRGKSYKIEIPIILFAVLCTTITGNIIGHYIAEFLRGNDSNWVTFYNQLIFNILLVAALAVITVIIEDITMRKKELEIDLKNINKRIQPELENQLISIKGEDGYHAIKFGDLIYLSSHGKKCAFHTLDDIYAVNQLLKYIEEKLPPDIFLRVHKQFIINLKYLKHIRYYEGGRYTAYLDDEDESIIPVGRNVARQLKEKLGL